MAQLSDDCFAFGGPPLSVADAVALIAARMPRIAGTEIVALGEADGRIAAEDVLAEVAIPPTDNSAVDGYAVRYTDLAPARETTLPVRGRVAAGGAAPALTTEPAAIRIFTGAPMPEGADTVFMQEDVRQDGDRVRLPPGLKRGANRRLAGEDIGSGEIAIPAGRRLRPQDLAVAAAIGLDRLRVRTRLRVGLFSTGNELVPPGMALGPGQIHDSNRALLRALVERLGARVSDFGILRDDPEVVERQLAEAAPNCDLLLASGGVSIGEEDHVKAAVERIGRLVFWRLAIKPGRPVAMGVIGGIPFVGLPGNPVAAYVTLLFLVAPLLARLGGAAPPAPLALPVRAAFTYTKKAGRREYVRVNLRHRPDGAVELVKFPRDGAGLLSSLTASDGLAELPEEMTAVAAGDVLTFIPHATLVT